MALPALCLPSVYPSHEAYLRCAPRARSPFLDLLDLPGGEALAPRLREGEALELEFDVIGRELRLVNCWKGYEDLWLAALTAAVDQRERQEAALG